MIAFVGKNFNANYKERRQGCISGNKTGIVLIIIMMMMIREFITARNTIEKFVTADS